MQGQQAPGIAVKPLTKAQLKNLKKKDKRKAQKEAAESKQNQDESSQNPKQLPDTATPQVIKTEQKAPQQPKKGKLSAAAKLALKRRQKIKQEEEKKKKQEEEAKQREEQQRLRLIRQAQEKKRLQQLRINQQKQDYKKGRLDGTILTDAEKKRKIKEQAIRRQVLAAIGDDEEGKQTEEDNTGEKDSNNNDKKAFVFKTKKSKKPKKAKDQEQIKISEDQNQKKNEMQKQQQLQNQEKQVSPNNQQDGDKEESKQTQKQKQQAQEKDWDDDDWDDNTNIKLNQKVLQQQNQQQDDDEDNAQNKSKSKDIKKTQLKDEQQDDQEQQAAEQSTKLKLPKEVIARRQAQSKGVKKNFRSPILCIMGHVDTGKTKILDKIRRTNVQLGQAGGITQQIGATFFPQDALIEKIGSCAESLNLEVNVPGLIIIDTPGHQSFTNLRSRGSSLCDMAILVIDIMHGIQNQTKQSIQLLRSRKTPFLVALNKIDRIYDWQATQNLPCQQALKKQKKYAVNEFEQRAKNAVTQLAVKQSLNGALYWKNDDPQSTVSLVPTSAHTGQGIPDLLANVVKMSQSYLSKRITITNQFKCTVLEVKDIEGHGNTIDVILVQGQLKVNQYIVLNSFAQSKPIVTKIRALLTPHPLKEMRVKGDYIKHQRISGTVGVKISATGLEDALAGSQLLATDDENEIQDLCEEVAGDIADIFKKYVNKMKPGVCVQASTLGSLQALLEYFKQQKIPVRSIGIGTIHKRHVLNAVTANQSKYKEFATILAFDVKTSPQGEEFAAQQGIKIFSAPIIYHLCDKFQDYLKKCIADRKQSQGKKAVFPCVLKIVAVFNAKKPIVLGVEVQDGIIKIGTPICVPDKENLRLGVVQSIQSKNKPIKSARAKDGAVAIKIAGDQSIQVNRHFSQKSQLISLVSRDSIDALKQYFKDEMDKDDWRLIMKLKKVFEIV